MGLEEADVGHIFNQATGTPPKNIPIPRNADELAEFIGDPGRFTPVVESKESLKQFIQAYADAQQGEGTELRETVKVEAQKAMTAWLKENEAEGLKRLNLDPHTLTDSVQRRYAVGYNPKAAGAVLDKEFPDTADFAKAIWHKNPDPKNAERMARIRNSFSSTVPADGGFLIPERLRSELLRVSLEKAMVRSQARVIPMDSLKVPIPTIDSTSNVSSVYGGMVAYWTEESGALTESQARFGRVILEAWKLTGYSVIPNELFQDSAISIAALIEQLWPEAIAFFEDIAFLRGSGAGEPLGVIGANNQAAIPVSKEAGQTANTIMWENIVKMFARMLPASQGQAFWLTSHDTFAELATMALSVGTGGGPVWLANGILSPAPSILGRPLRETEKVPTLGTRGDISYQDLSYYLIGDRQTMMADSSPHYRFANDQTAFRIIERVTGRPWLQSAITPYNGGPTVSPHVELETRS